MDDSKLNELIKILKNFRIDEIMYFEENYDEQYKALRYLYKNLQNEELFLRLVIANSLISYQLSDKGEIYWWNFAKFFSYNKQKDICGAFNEFVNRYNKRFANIKIQRSCRFINSSKNIKLLDYCNKGSLKDLQILLARIMSQKPEDKTIVFAIKMFGYGCRILGYRFEYPKDIPIPIDSRIQKISKNIKFWRIISKKTKIPQLHIDSIIWVTYGLNYKDLYSIKDIELKKKLINIKRFLKEILE